MLLDQVSSGWGTTLEGSKLTWHGYFKKSYHLYSCLVFKTKKDQSLSVMTRSQ